VAVSTTSQKYVAQLAGIKGEYDKVAKELGKSAGEAFRAIYDIIDLYDNNDIGESSLRHVYNENVNIVRKAYDFEFTYQPGLYLIDQLRALKYFDRNSVLEHITQKDSDLLEIFKSKSNPASTNDKIFQSKTFNKNLASLYGRIPESSEPQIFIDAMKCAYEYIKLHERSRVLLRQLLEKMESMERENQLEIFNLNEIPKLGDGFRRLKGDATRLVELGLVDFMNYDQFKNYDGISHVLYIGSVLQLASQYHSWGLYSDRMPS
jgi:hypothetical protein